MAKFNVLYSILSTVVYSILAPEVEFTVTSHSKCMCGTSSVLFELSIYEDTLTVKNFLSMVVCAHMNERGSLIIWGAGVTKVKNAKKLTYTCFIAETWSNKIFCM